MPGSMGRWIGARAFLLSVLVLCAARGDAQPRKAVVMQHGFFGDEGTWTNATVNLQSTFDADFIRTRTGFYNTFERQARLLDSIYYTGTGSNAAFVAHSFGGLVGRYEMSRPYGLHWRGMLTVGTPHLGYQLAAKMVSHEATQTSGRVLNNISAPFLFYVVPQVSALEAAILDEVLYDILTAALGLYAFPTITGNASASVFPEASPGSAFLSGASGVNTAGGLGAELLTPERWELTSVATLVDGSTDYESGLACRIIVGSRDASQFCFGVQLAVSLWYQAEFEKYANMSPGQDPIYWQSNVTNSIRWLNGYWEWRTLDHTWCGLIGGLVAGVCTPSDGLIPANVSSWPGATRHTGLANLSHLEQAGSSRTWAEIALFLQASQIPLRQSGGSGNGLSVGQVAGPAQVEAGVEAAFSVSASSGQGPLSYVWKVNNYSLQAGASPLFSYTNGGADFVVAVTVSDGIAAYTRSKSVTIGTCGAFSC